MRLAQRLTLGLHSEKGRGRDAKGFIWNLRAVIGSFSEPPQMVKRIQCAGEFICKPELSEPGIQPFRMEGNSLLKMVEQLPC